MKFREVKKVLICDLSIIVVLGGLVLPVFFKVIGSSGTVRSSGARIELFSGNVIETRTPEETASAIEKNKGKIKTAEIKMSVRNGPFGLFSARSFSISLVLPAWALISARKRLAEWFNLKLRFVPMGLVSGIGVLLISAGAAFCLRSLGAGGLVSATNSFAGVSCKWVFFVCGSILGPISEEIYYRGRLMGALEADWGKTAGLWVSAGLFGLVHSTSFDLPI